MADAAVKTKSETTTPEPEQELTDGFHQIGRANV